MFPPMPIPRGGLANEKPQWTLKRGGQSFENKRVMLFNKCRAELKIATLALLLVTPITYTLGIRLFLIDSFQSGDAVYIPFYLYSFITAFCIIYFRHLAEKSGRFSLTSRDLNVMIWILLLSLLGLTISVPLSGLFSLIFIPPFAITFFLWLQLSSIMKKIRRPPSIPRPQPVYNIPEAANKTLKLIKFAGAVRISLIFPMGLINLFLVMLEEGMAAEEGPYGLATALGFCWFFYFYLFFLLFTGVFFIHLAKPSEDSFFSERLRRLLVITAAVDIISLWLVIFPLVTDTAGYARQFLFAVYSVVILFAIPTCIIPLSTYRRINDAYRQWGEHVSRGGWAPGGLYFARGIAEGIFLLFLVNPLMLALPSLILLLPSIVLFKFRRPRIHWIVVAILLLQILSSGGTHILLRVILNPILSAAAIYSLILSRGTYWEWNALWALYSRTARRRAPSGD